MGSLIDSLNKSRKSFGYAFKGIGILIRYENNFRIQLVVAVLTIVLGFVLKIDMIEWLVVILMIGLVLMAEASNTALEKFLDVLHPEIHPSVAQAKDIAAGAVLLISITATVVGCIIFGDKVWELFLRNLSF